RVRRDAVLLPAGADHSDHKGDFPRQRGPRGRPGDRRARVIAVERWESTRGRAGRLRPAMPATNDGTGTIAALCAAPTAPPNETGRKSSRLAPPSARPADHDSEA